MKMILDSDKSVVLDLLRKALSGDFVDSLALRSAAKAVNYNLSEAEEATLVSLGDGRIENMTQNAVEEFGNIAENIHKLLSSFDNNLYTLIHLPTGDLFSGLTKERVTDKIYKYESGCFEISFSEKIYEIQSHNHVYIWDASYRRSNKGPWLETQITTKSGDKAEAIIKFLEKLFDESAWDESRWRVFVGNEGVDDEIKLGLRHRAAHWRI
jgi:hypothetical protein